MLAEKPFGKKPWQFRKPLYPRQMCLSPVAFRGLGLMNSVNQTFFLFSREIPSFFQTDKTSILLLFRQAQRCWHCYHCFMLRNKVATQFCLVCSTKRTRSLWLLACSSLLCVHKQSQNLRGKRILSSHVYFCISKAFNVRSRKWQ